MLRRLLHLDPDADMGYMAWSLGSDWPRLALVLGLIAAVALAVVLYRRETGISRRWRAALGLLRGVLLTVVVLMLFEPTLAVEVTARLKRVVLVLVDQSKSMAIEDVNGKSRSAAVRDVLSDGRSALLEALLRDHDVRLFAFDDALEHLESSTLQDTEPTGTSTALGSAIGDAVGRFAGSPMAGVVVLTDGGSNTGVSPATVAAQLARRGIGLYPVGVGQVDPPDVAIDELLVQDAAFTGDRVPLHLSVRASGFAGVEADVVIALDGETVASKTVTLQAEPALEHLAFTPERHSGTVTLSATIRPRSTTREATLANNTIEQPVRIIDEKIKVLYLEGKPRWEYRYLRAVLLRDRRIDARFVMLEGDQDMARVSDEFLRRFPATPEELFEYDLVIIGDVPPGQPAQMRLVDELVRQRGGSVLFLAGRRYMPMAYDATPLAGALPIVPGTGPRQAVGDERHPAVTSAGLRSPVVMLEQTPAANDAAWSLLRPMYDLPPVAGIKPGAITLLEIPADRRGGHDYPLVTWHRYGAGKSMFVGTDQLWRLRFKRGDEYHARFWGQAIGFLTMSRLLGENKRVRIQTDRNQYQLGQRVQVYATVLDEGYNPVTLGSYTVALESQAAAGDPMMLTLEASPDADGLFVGYATAHAHGRYTLSAIGPDQAAANTATFDVVEVDLEHVRPGQQRDELIRLAKTTGGRYLELEQVDQLPQLLAKEPPAIVERRQFNLWDHPAVFMVVLALAGVEWFVRRRKDLV